jgi:hypothetical protein
MSNNKTSSVETEEVIIITLKVLTLMRLLLRMRCVHRCGGLPTLQDTQPLR